MNEKIIAHLRSTNGAWQTGREIAQALGFAAGTSRPVIDATIALYQAGTVEQESHDGLMGSGPKRYRLVPGV